MYARLAFPGQLIFLKVSLSQNVLAYISRVLNVMAMVSGIRLYFQQGLSVENRAEILFAGMNLFVVHMYVLFFPQQMNQCDITNSLS